jgi:hypothetical protein
MEYSITFIRSWCRKEKFIKKILKKIKEVAEAEKPKLGQLANEVKTEIAITASKTVSIFIEFFIEIRFG